MSAPGSVAVTEPVGELAGRGPVEAMLAREMPITKLNLVRARPLGNGVTILAYTPR